MTTHVMTIDRDRTFALDDETIVTIGGKPARLGGLGLALPFVVHLGDESVTAFRIEAEEFEHIAEQRARLDEENKTAPPVMTLDRDHLAADPGGAP